MKTTNEQNESSKQMQKFIESAANGVDILYAVQWLFDRLHPQLQEATLIFALDMAKEKNVVGAGNPGWISEVNESKIAELYPDNVQLVRVIYWLWLSVFENGKGKYRDTVGRLSQLITILNNKVEFYNLTPERQNKIFGYILYSTETHIDRLIRNNSDVPKLEPPD